MNKGFKTALTLFTVFLFLLSTTVLAIAADKKDDNEIPKGMVLVNADQINPNLSMDSQSYYLPVKAVKDKKGEVDTQAANVWRGATTSDYNWFGPNNDGKCKIYSKVDEDDGFWDGVFYTKFSGYGQTKWYGTSTPTEISASVKVSATGVYPKISLNGSSWAVMYSSADLGTTENSPSDTEAKHSYYNCKIQRIGNLTAIFTNYAYIKLPGVGGNSSSEDTWWWF